MVIDMRCSTQQAQMPFDENPVLMSHMLLYCPMLPAICWEAPQACMITSKTGYGASLKKTLECDTAAIDGLFYEAGNYSTQLMSLQPAHCRKTQNGRR